MDFHYSYQLLESNETAEFADYSKSRTIEVSGPPSEVQDRKAIIAALIDEYEIGYISPFGGNMYRIALWYHRSFLGVYEVICREQTPEWVHFKRV